MRFYRWLVNSFYCYNTLTIIAGARILVASVFVVRVETPTACASCNMLQQQQQQLEEANILCKKVFNLNFSSWRVACADVDVDVESLPLSLDVYICRNVGNVSVAHGQRNYPHGSALNTPTHTHTHTRWPCTIDAYIVLENYYVVFIGELAHMCATTTTPTTIANRSLSVSSTWGEAHRSVCQKCLNFIGETVNLSGSSKTLFQLRSTA